MLMGPLRRDECVLWIVGIMFYEATMRLVKVLWQHRRVEEATWEHEDTIRVNYPFLFEVEGMFLVIDTK